MSHIHAEDFQRKDTSVLKTPLQLPISVLKGSLAEPACFSRQTLLQQLSRQRAEHHETLRLEVRQRLKNVLRQLAPADQVVVFGSLARPYRFTDTSDIDIALKTEPSGMTLYQLTGLLAEQMGRPVDVILLSECRFRDRIAREGETWTLAA